MDLPIKQISKSQWLATHLKIEPDAKVMQADFGGQTSLEASEVMRTLTSQAEGVEQFVVDRFDDLSQTVQPTTPLPLAALMRRTDDLGPIALLPLGMRVVSCEHLIGHVDALGFVPDTGPGREISEVSGKCCSM